MKTRLLLLIIAVCLVCACASAPPPPPPEPPFHRFAFMELAVVDEGTGLVWTRNANMPGKPLYWKAEENVYSFIQRLNRENYAGYGDWRLPTREEMEALLEFAMRQGFDPTRMDTWPHVSLKRMGFSEVRDYGYWTKTRNPEDPRLIYIGNMMTGQVNPQPETGAYCVWPVRGGR